MALKAKQIIRYRKKLYGVLRSEATGRGFLHILTIQRLDSEGRYILKLAPIRIYASLKGKARR
jgi:hypothetical protein